MYTIPYLKQGRTFEYISEPYVASPPAAYVISEDRRTFCLGLTLQDLRDAPAGHYAYRVLIDGQPTDEFASHIEKRNNRVRIFTRGGYWKVWTGSSFV